MRFHLLAVPNCPTDPEQYPLDGFCFRTWAFAALLKLLGHEVIFYGVEGSLAPADLRVECLSQKEWQDFISPKPYQEVPFDAGSPLFQMFNSRAAAFIRSNKRSDDIIATIAGGAQALVGENHPELRFLEYSIGYRGVTSAFRVFESHTWRHVIHGFTHVDTCRTFDAVIPPWWDPEMFPFEAEAEDYAVFCGRIQHAKGIGQACRAAQEAGIPLMVIGHGDRSLVTYGEIVGSVSNAERNRLLSKARVCLMPTQYLEPFGNVSAEAQLCGTPVLGPGLGGFTETVAPGLSGFHCATTGEYVQAIDLARHLNRQMIRDRAARLYGTTTALKSYAYYFKLIDLARQSGIDSLHHTLEFSHEPRSLKLVPDRSERAEVSA